MKLVFLIVPVLTVLLVGCAGRANVAHDVYQAEKFEWDSPFRSNFDDTPQDVCESAQFALLSQGYRITAAEKASVTAQKDFQPNTDANVVINLTIVCRGRPSGSILFASALQTIYELKKEHESTSVGISALGSVSLPLGSTSGALVKVGAETISNKDFYERLFALVHTYLDHQEARPFSVNPVN